MHGTDFRLQTFITFHQNVTQSSNFSKPNSPERFVYLEQPGEDVELKDRDVVVACQVDGGLEGHGLQAQADGVELVEGLTKRSP